MRYVAQLVRGRLTHHKMSWFLNKALFLPLLPPPNPGTVDTTHHRRAPNKNQVNQIGSVTESIKAVKMSKQLGWGVMTSHRSGETEDNYIADIAVGLCTGQIKTGAPCRSERLAKYNQASGRSIFSRGGRGGRAHVRGGRCTISQTCTHGGLHTRGMFVQLTYGIEYGNREGRSVVRLRLRCVSWINLLSGLGCDMSTSRGLGSELSPHTQWVPPPSSLTYSLCPALRLFSYVVVPFCRNSFCASRRNSAARPYTPDRASERRRGWAKTYAKKFIETEQTGQKLNTRKRRNS